MCKNAYAQLAATTSAPDASSTPDGGTTPSGPPAPLIYNEHMCDTNNRIVFNLLDNSVYFNGARLGYLVSPVADFMLDKTTGQYSLKVTNMIGVTILDFSSSKT